MARGRRMKAGARTALTKLSGPLSWRYGRDLTDAARRGQLDPVIGRDEEFTRLIQILGRKTKNNPVLIGKSGVGKTAIVEGLALRIADGEVPAGLQGKRVVSLDLASMLAGARIRGEFEERLKSALALLAVSKGEFLLLIDELHMIVGTGGGDGGMDVSNMLKPMLARGELRLIGASTPEEYRKHVEKDAALERQFQPVYRRARRRCRTPWRSCAACGSGTRSITACGSPDCRHRGRGGAVRPVRDRPPPAGQGGRPDRRGGQPGADRHRVRAARPGAGHARGAADPPRSS